MNYRADIQVMRGIAVLMVLLFHFGVSAFHSGFLGVDVFFVISGFLMAQLYKKGHAKEFYSRRAKRLLPAYFSTVAITLIASAILTVPSDYSQVKQQSLFSIFYASNIGFWQQNSYFSKAEFNPLLHLWSLGVEIQFYLVVPIIAAVFRKNKLLFVMLGLISLALCLAFITISPKTSFFMTPLRGWEFLLGYWAANTSIGKLHISEKKPPPRVTQTIALGILVCLPLIPVDGQSLSILYGHPASFALLVTVATAISLALGLPQWFIKSAVGKTLEKLGNYSYSIYLVHFPIIVLANYEPFGGTILAVNSLLHSATQLLLVALVSFLSYQLIEKRISTKPFKIITGGTITILVLSFIGSLFQDTRFSREQLHIFYAWQDRAPYRCGKLFRITNPKDNACPLVSNTKNKLKPIMLVGNSHADSIKMAFSATAKQLGYQTFFYVPNTPLMRGSPIKAQTVIDDAKTIGAKKIVLHFSHKGVDMKELNLLSKTATKNGLKVAVIAPVPTYSSHVPKMLYSQSLGQALFQDKTIQDYEEEHKKELAKLRALSEITLTETAPLLCAPICRLTNNNGRLLYFDETHLTLSGAVLLNDAYIEALSR